MTDETASPPVDVSAPACRFALAGIKVVPFRLGALLVVVASLLIAFTWKVPSINDNVASRLATVESIVERHTVQIDRSRFAGTIDKVRIRGHFYSEKPPLLSFIVAGPYGALHLLGFDLSGTETYSILTLLVMGSSFLLCLACFYDAVRRVGLDESSATWMTAMLSLGTIYLSFSTNLNNHSFPASWLFIGLYAMLRAINDERGLWMRAAGLSFALALGADYSTALIIAPLGLYILWHPALRRRWTSVALPCTFILVAGVAFNYLISGSLRFVQVHPEFFHYPGSHWNPGGEPLSGIERNSLSFAARYAWQLMFARNGFLLYCPLLLFAIATGIFRIIRRRPHWQLFAAVLVGCAAYVAFYALYSANFGGANYSTRWFVAFIPLLWFLAYPLFLSKGRWLRLALLAAFGVSIPIVMIGLLDPWTPGAPAILENLNRWRLFGPTLVIALISMASIIFAWSMLRANRRGESFDTSAPVPTDGQTDGWTRRRAWLAGILLVAFVLRLGIALALPSADSPNEIFEVREQAHRLVYGYGIVPWQFRDGTESWVLPGLLSIVIRATAWLGLGAYGYTLGIDFFLCALSLICVWVGFRWGERIGGPTAAIVVGATCAVWHGLIHYAPQALTQAAAAYALLPGLYLAYFANRVAQAPSPVQSPGRVAQAPSPVQSPRSGEVLQARASETEIPGPNSAVRQFGSSTVGGLLLGLSIAFEPELAPAVLVAAIWICRSDFRRWAAMSVGIVLPVLAFGIVDAYTWGHPFASYLDSFTINVLHHRNNVYGKQPFYWYFAEIGRRVGVILFALVIGARRSWFLTWVAITVLATELLFAHKEYRFIFPMVPILCVLIGLGLASPLWQRAAGFARRPLLGAIAVAVIASAAWASQLDVWLRFAGPIEVGHELSVRQDLCGLGVAQGIYGTGGYFYLHQDVPIFLASEKVHDNAGAYNYITSPLEFQDSLPPEYQLQICLRGYCIFQRPGSCEPVPGYNLNNVLRDTDR